MNNYNNSNEKPELSTNPIALKGPLGDLITDIFRPEWKENIKNAEKQIKLANQELAKINKDVITAKQKLQEAKKQVIAVNENMKKTKIAVEQAKQDKESALQEIPKIEQNKKTMIESFLMLKKLELELLRISQINEESDSEK